MSGLEGVALLTKRLKELGQLENGNALRRAVRAGIKPAQQRAKQLIPTGIDTHRTYKGNLVLPGFAKRNIRSIVTMSRDRQKASALLGVRREAFYAIDFVELGTSKMAPRPWLRPAFSSTRQQQLAALKQSLVKSVLKASRRR